MKNIFTKEMIADAILSSVKYDHLTVAELREKLTGKKFPGIIKVRDFQPRYVNIYDAETDTGYCGLIPATELFTGPELAAKVGLTAGTAFNNDVDWLMFYIGPKATCNKEGGKQYYLLTPLRPLRYNLSWDHINAAGVARGDMKTDIEGDHTYKVRLLSGGNSVITQTDPVTNPDHPVHSEWNQLIYRVHQEVPKDTEFLSGGPQKGDNWANFSDTELGVNWQASPNGGANWCMEDWFSNSSGSVNRGYYSVAHVGGTVSSNVNTSYGWRPALIQLISD